MNIETIQTLIKDFQSALPKKLTLRSLQLPQIKDMSVSIVGVRRCGKTYRTYQLAQSLITAGNDAESVCRIQFNDHRLATLAVSDLSIIDHAYYSLFPSKRRGVDQVYFIFDEIQRINGWEDYILSLLDTSTHQIYITGSSSKLLRGDIATGLRGKNFAVELLPFSFREFCAHYEITDDTISSDGRAQARALMEHYLNQGGFPGLLDLDSDRHIDMLQSYWDTMTLRDIVEAHPHDNLNAITLTVLAQTIAGRIGCPVTVRKLAALLKEMGIQSALETLHRYIAYLDEAFMLTLIPFFSSSSSVRNRNYRKPYAIDWALADAVAAGGPLGISRKLENAVYVELRRRAYDVYYYRTRKDYEIDFVVTPRQKQRNSIEIFQVCYRMDTPEVIERELRGIPEAASFLGANHATIITMDDERTISTDGVEIRVVPAWKWFLQG
jgi:predicted AAA+ superfamily ATPase